MARYSNKELSYIGRQIALSLTHERFTTEYLDIIISNHRSLRNPFLLYCIGNSLLVIQRNQTTKKNIFVSKLHSMKAKIH